MTKEQVKNIVDEVQKKAVAGTAGMVTEVIVGVCELIRVSVDLAEGE